MLPTRRPASAKSSMVSPAIRQVHGWVLNTDGACWEARAAFSSDVIVGTSM
jgi:hypothetical protein